jgi:type 1 fimbria pilin
MFSVSMFFKKKSAIHSKGILKMKLKLIALAIPALFVASSALAVEGESSTVNFTGSIVETSCSLNTGSKGQTVPLGDVATTAFTGTGTSSQEKPFSITLDGCKATETPSTVTVTFSGNTVSGKADALTTSAADTTNVGVQILQAGEPLTLDGSATSTAQELVEGSNNLQFTARYVALADTVSAGEANATANFTLNYQ